jgi:FkbM family methyltransferase
MSFLPNFTSPPSLVRFWKELWGTPFCAACGQHSIPEYEPNAEFETPPQVLDIGACVGAAAYWFHSRYPGCVVHCYEPNPKAHRILDKNLARLPEGSFTLSKTAVMGAHALETGAARPKTVRLHQGRHNLGEASMFVETGALPDDYVDVPVTFAKDLPGCDFLKADCEGPEREILVEYLSSHAPPVCVAIEFHSAGESVRVQRLMAENKYRLVRASEYEPNRGVLVWRHEPELG